MLSRERQTLAQTLMASPSVRAHQVRSVLGMMAAAHPVVRLRLLHMQRLQRWFNRLRLHPTQGRQVVILLLPAAREDLEFWLAPGRLQQGVRMGCIPHHVEVFTDASLVGWGGTFGQSAVGGAWESPPAHINLMEMMTVQRMLSHFLSELLGEHVFVRSDKSTVVAYLNRQGGPDPSPCI